MLLSNLLMKNSAEVCLPVRFEKCKLKLRRRWALFKVFLKCIIFDGTLSIGLPHKETAVSCCDEVDPLAKSIGAVNTIVRRPSDGKLVGYNTDCDACVTAIEDALVVVLVTRQKWAKPKLSPIAGRLFVLVGAGGNGRALAFGAKSKGARVVIFIRNFERAQSLARAVSGEALPIEQLNTYCPENGMILANCSAIGMEPDVHLTPVSKDNLGSRDLVFDAVYTPRNTRLTFTPFGDAVCTSDGSVFDIMHIVPYIRKYGRHPVSGVELKQEDLIPLLFDDAADTETKTVSFPTTTENLGRGIKLLQHGQKHSFMFGKVFVPESSQQEVFLEVSQLVQSALDGYKVSMLEIYNETIRDLLSTNRPVLVESSGTKQHVIRHDANGNTHVSDLTIVDVHSSREVSTA